MISDKEIAAEITAQALARAPKSLCPSEVARSLTTNWRPLMPDIRRVAATLSHIKTLQNGQEVDPCIARGPIRLSLADPQ